MDVIYLLYKLPWTVLLNMKPHLQLNFTFYIQTCGFREIVKNTVELNAQYTAHNSKENEHISSFSL